MKKKFCLLLLTIFLSTKIAYAQDFCQWATYYGDTASDYGYSVATDASGNVYLAGTTSSTAGIAAGGFQNTHGGKKDAFLVKFDPTGKQLWATYYGDTADDYGKSIAIDTSGNIYLAGHSKSPSGIASGGFQNIYGGNNQDAFLVKFDPSGNRLWATYYGETAWAWGYSVATDSHGNAYLAGTITSGTNISSGGFQNTYGGGGRDAFIVKFDPLGNRLWATYFGGPSTEEGHCIAVDQTGNIYFSGETASSSGIAMSGFQNTLAGSYDSFVLKLDALGNRLWSTYYGAINNDYGQAIAIDALGNLYLAGFTDSPSGLASGGFQNSHGGGVWDAFMVKFTPGGNRLWSTYYGSADPEEVYGIATDAFGNVYLAGDSYSSSNIATGGYQNNLAGEENLFVAKFDSSGNRLCATYFGQTHEEDGNITIDQAGNLYLSGSTNSPLGMAFGGHKNSYGGGKNDAFLAKLSPCFNPIRLTASSTNLLCNSQCNGVAIANPGGGTLPYAYIWSNGQTIQTATGLCAGIYSVTVNDAIGNDTITSVTITEPTSLWANVNNVINVACNGFCDGKATVIDSGGTPGYSYSWSTAIPQSIPTATGLCAGTYSVIITDKNGCTQQQTTTITEPLPISILINVIPTICSDYTGTALANVSGGIQNYTYAWDTAPVQTTMSITGLNAGLYAVMITDSNGCVKTQSVIVTQTPPPTAAINASAIKITIGDSVQLLATGGKSYQWATTGGLNCDTCINLFFIPQETNSYCVLITDSNGCTDEACIVIEVICGEVFVPTAFSPNGDGINEFECVLGHCIKSFYFSIYDRWGNKLFETSDLNKCWDGRYKNYPVNTSVFTYFLEAQLLDGKQIIKKGNISLIR